MLGLSTEDQEAVFQRDPSMGYQTNLQLYISDLWQEGHCESPVGPGLYLQTVKFLTCIYLKYTVL